MEHQSDQFLFVERYRPATIDQCILPDRYKKIFNDFVAKGEIPNLLLTGGPGVGKTTIAKALGNALNADVMVINASENGNIDTLRTQIRGFASTMSLMGGIKIVILDEADYLNANSTQPALRNFIEEFSKNCRFILTANYANRIIKELHSRLVTIDFSITDKEYPKMATQFMKRCEEILLNENITYKKPVLAEIIKTYFPDYRKTLNELQRHTSSGTLNEVPTDFDEDAVTILIEFLQKKEFTKMRKWVAEHTDMDPIKIMRGIVDRSMDIFESAFVPDAILLYNTYDYRNAFVADKEINLVAFLTEVMVNGEFK